MSLAVISVTSQCYSSSSIKYATSGKQLTVNGQTMAVQGIAWFGLETNTFSPGGLRSTSVEALLDILVAQKFNVLRIPFSVDMILKPRMPTAIDYNLNPNLAGKTGFQVIEYITKACGDRGILVVMELHRFDPNDYISELWYTTSCLNNIDGQCINYTTQMVIDTWITVTNQLKKYWNFWAVDVKNEPHGAATWGTGNTNTDWNTAFINIANSIQSATSFNGVYFIEGIENNAGSLCSPSSGNWWGGNLSPQQCFPVFLATPNKVVFTPHTYCSSVSDQPYFNDANYPNNMPAVWDASFGFLRNRNSPMVVGEWGCATKNNKNVQWVNAFTNYLKSTGQTNHIYFSLNPDSADTDSILGLDWKTVNSNVASYLSNIGTNPTKFTVFNDQVCLGNSQPSTTTAPATTSSSTTAPATTSSSTTAPATTSSSTTAPATTSSSTTAPATTSSSTTAPATTSSSTTAPATTSSSSTTAPATTSSSTTAPATTSSSTTAPATTSSSTTAPSTTTGSTTTGGNPKPITITQSLTSSWTDGAGKPWGVYNCYITNTGPTPLNNVQLKATPNVNPYQSWGAFVPANVGGQYIWSAQSWSNPLPPNQAINFGYQIQSASPISFTVL
ncbi:hypothetical protein SAMD00019534_079190 [Acytostelium subglobosum LB1]|uniref:hypothetical protein n=1 Tax=Acytostelium subglobosum LB1 TaxID=1410327 RepID=UPI000644F6C1|nr:hypothetical protein SAMD00019534_079190 [Acytostelium subglobosum LB1]GAM24744.1 hypothetical protein SAMD00019534_079190 [Acytostelium subglobosum LB1]|eukprot:XP_012752413.1 hypothetical protein SAMD00019534_079190 [Acytostelium subglobosum LB1]